MPTARLVRPATHASKLCSIGGNKLASSHLTPLFECGKRKQEPLSRRMTKHSHWVHPRNPKRPASLGPFMTRTVFLAAWCAAVSGFRPETAVGAESIVSVRDNV